MAVANHIQNLAAEILQQDGFALGMPIAYRGISVVPIVQNEAPLDKEEYLNAAQALEENVLDITEAGDDVSTILARNIGTDPILIEEAEVLVGVGSQDRIVIESTVLQPGETARIPVKCVHAPHALRRGSRFVTIGHGSIGLKSQLRAKKYRSIMTDVEHYVPMAAVDQKGVWEEVRRYCSSLGIDDVTKYTKAMEKIQKKAKEMADELREHLPPGTCGLVLVTDEERAIAMEFYRNAKPFNQRVGFLEAMLVEYSDEKKKSPTERKAKEVALGLLKELHKVKEDTIFSKEDSNVITVGVGELKGEAVTGKASDGEKVLYCSLGI